MKDVYKVLENFASDALLDKEEYIKMYKNIVNYLYVRALLYRNRQL